MAGAFVPWVPAFSRNPDTGLPVVTGRYEERDPLDDAPSQRVECRCAVCGAEFRVTCTSGQPRQWIQRFAKEHQQEHFGKFRRQA
jgi:hypothetical protein